MANYKTYLKAGCPAVRVKQGFSWAAFCFGFLWAFYHRLWWYGGILLAYNGLLMWTAGSILTASAGSLCFQLILNIGVSSLMGRYSNAILEYDLKRRGYRPEGSSSLFPPFATPPLSSKSQGFTLIELIIVVVVIGVLVAIGAALYIDNTQTARLKRLQSLADSIGAASALNYEAYLFHEPYQSTAGKSCSSLLSATGMLAVQLPSGVSVSGTIFSVSADHPIGSADKCLLTDANITNTAQQSILADMVVTP